MTTKFVSAMQTSLLKPPRVAGTPEKSKTDDVLKPRGANHGLYAKIARMTKNRQSRGVQPLS